MFAELASLVVKLGKPAPKPREGRGLGFGIALDVELNARDETLSQERRDRRKQAGAAGLVREQGVELRLFEKGQRKVEGRVGRGRTRIPVSCRNAPFRIDGGIE
jgi:hypothetical protein